MTKEHLTKEHDYRLNAVETLDLANKASTSADKVRLLRLAEKWLDLADRMRRGRRRPKRAFGEHPLVRRRLGGEQQDVEQA